MIAKMAMLQFEMLKRIKFFIFLLLLSSCAAYKPIERKEYKVVYGSYGIMSDMEYISIEHGDIDEVLKRKLSLELNELSKGYLSISIVDGEVSMDSLKVLRLDGVTLSFYKNKDKLDKKFKPKLLFPNKSELMGKTFHASRRLKWN